METISWAQITLPGVGIACAQACADEFTEAASPGVGGAFRARGSS
jgi:hypothetical protein